MDGSSTGDPARDEAREGRSEGRRGREGELGREEGEEVDGRVVDDE